MRIAYLATSLLGFFVLGTLGCSDGETKKPSRNTAGTDENGGTENNGGSGGSDTETGGKGGTAGSDDTGGGGAGGNGGGGEAGTSGGDAGNGGTPPVSTCSGTPINIVWEEGWMALEDNEETGVRGPWYTYKDARDTTTTEPAEKEKVTGNCVKAHIEPKVTASTDWGAGFGCDLNSEGGESPVKNPLSKPFKSLCIDVTIENGAVDLELPMQDQADSDPPFGIRGLKNGPNLVDLTTLKKSTWGTPVGTFDVSKLISLKLKMNSSTKATDTKVCVNGISVEM